MTVCFSKTVDGLVDVSVSCPEFDGTPKKFLVKMVRAPWPAVWTPEEVMKLSKVLEEAAEFAKRSQDEYDEKLREKRQLDEAKKVFDACFNLRGGLELLFPIVELIVERDRLKAELDALKKEREIHIGDFSVGKEKIEWDVEKEKPMECTMPFGIEHG